MNTAKQMYALDIYETAELINVVGSDQTVIAIGDMGSGKSAMLKMVTDFTYTQRLLLRLYHQVMGDWHCPSSARLMTMISSTVTTQELGFHEKGPIVLMLDESFKNRSIINALNRIMYEKSSAVHVTPDDRVFLPLTKQARAGGHLATAPA